MSNGYERFKEWMKTNALNHRAQCLIAEHLPKIRWAFQLHDSGAYQPIEAGRLDEALFAESIKQALGQDVRKVIPISITEPLFDKPDWMAQGEYNASLSRSRGMKPHNLIWNMFERASRDSMTRSWSERLAKERGASLQWSSCWDAIGDAVGDKEVDSFCRSSLWFFTEALFAGNRDMAQQLLPLVWYTLPRTIPFGPTVDEPSTWITLVK